MIWSNNFNHISENSKKNKEVQRKIVSFETSGSSEEESTWNTEDGKPFFGKNPNNITDLAAKQTFLSPEKNVHHQIKEKKVDSKVSLTCRTLNIFEIYCSACLF